MNLFASMILQSLVRLVIYVDQYVARREYYSGDGHGGGKGEGNEHKGFTNQTLAGIENSVRKLILYYIYVIIL